ncbi:MAG: ATP-dependent RecD-like DNA helicase [Actinobacteria bacterium ADurb.Bin346]|nr:MAG: ATP-dependent RecD-like DNA helicase [Actinobacteria bacterium ADurb.Bin346]
MVEKQPEKIKGALSKIVYKNPDNDYFIGRLITEEDHRQITVVGYGLNINPGEMITATGCWVNNKKYGLQFEIECIEVAVPATEEGIKKYLGSGLIRGIGPVIASRIVKTFGLDTLNIMDSHPGRLNEVEGLGKKRINLIKLEWKKQRDIRDIMIFMQSCGISTNYSIKIYNSYGNNSTNILKTNPYRLIEDVAGIGFKTADSIAFKMGIEKDSFFRIKSGILYLLNEVTDSGNCYYPLEDFYRSAMELLECGEPVIIKAVKELHDEGKIVTSDNGNGRIYLKQIYEDEQYVASALAGIRDTKKFFDYNPETNLQSESQIDKSFQQVNTDLIQKEILRISVEKNIELDEIQTEAVIKAIYEKVLVITGSPGTGKSTILDIITSYYDSHSCKVMICAPTGRAAKRLTEATGKEASTIHRLLKYQPKINRFLKDENNPLDSDLVVVDEASMIDIRLFKALIKSLKKTTTLILVGDVDQLPAVGPGNVLSDIIASGVFTVVKLERIYRQGGKSRIIYNAHRIRDGLFPVIARNQDTDDFFFIDRIEPDEVVELILHLLIKRIPSSFDYDPLKDIQVIVPTNRGVVGVNNLNLKIQEQLNKNNTRVFGEVTGFKLKDRVIQLKNNYEKEVYNGDIGFISETDNEMKTITVDYDSRQVQYDFYDLDQLSLSYAISIHKSQGSEFKCVIIPILTSHYMLLQRNLLYTAITRARELAILIGSKKAIGIAVNKNIVEQRFTSLKELLKKF